MRYLMRTTLALCLFNPAMLVSAESKPLSERMQGGEKIYRAACARCHDSGAGGAPLIGQQQSWEGRSDLWEAVLFEHAENGYLSMPAQGGDSRLTDYEAEAAAEFMVQSSFPERPAD
jgi:cytochrome c5